MHWLQAASGMVYALSLQCVHRDLAARNVLLDENFVAMISALVCHVMYTKVVNTKRCLGYVIKSYLLTRLQRCITIGYGNNWVISIPAPCLCEYRTWTRVRWNVVEIVGNMARYFPRKLTGNGRITFSSLQVVSLQRFDWYWESFLWSISAQKKVNCCLFKYSSLC